VYGEHDYEVLTSSREGLQRQEDHFGSKQRHDTDGYNIIPFGYCTYRNRSDDGKFAFNINTISEKAIVSKFYPVFRFTNANSTFMAEFLNSSPRVKKKLSVLAVGTSQVVLSFEALKAAKFDLPCKDEQDKIAAFLECLNTRIENQRTLVVALKKYKRGVVDGIFSRKLNFSYPQTWAELEISELFMPISDKGYSDKIVLTIVQGEGTMPRDSVDRRIAYDKSTISSYKRVLPNDFILHLRSFEGGLEIVNEEGVVSPAYTILRARNEIIPLFFYTFFRSYWFINSKLRISVEGIRDGKSINMNTFWHIRVPVPSIEEQRHISALISSIDNRIKIAEFEYKRLLQIRVGLMQQLFI
jgi:type I restriction enzyme S subunit